MEKIKEVLNKILNSKIFIIIIGIILVLKTMFFYSNTINSVNNIKFETIIGTIVFILVLICTLNILPNKSRIITILIINFIISSILFSDNLYYLHSSNIISVEQISNLKYSEEIKNTLPNLANISHIIYYLDLIIIFILFVTRLIKIEKQENRKLKTKKLDISIFIIGIILFILVETGYIKKGIDNSWNKNDQITEATIYGYHISDIINFFNLQNKAKYETYEEMISEYNNLKSEYKENYSKEQYNYKNILENKNIIILQLESVQEFVAHKTINGKEITPNLNKFLDENTEFINMHMQSYSSTADSEHSVVTSTYPLENGMSYSKYFANTYDNLFEMFYKNNYHTSYMHGNVGTFWNRENVYSRMNINDIKFIEDFEDQSEMISGYLADELFYKQAVKYIQQYDEPFISFLVAASSHTGFDLPGIQNREQKINIDVGEYKDTYFGRYLEAVNYADYAFGILIDELKKAGLYEDTAIIIYGDHNGVGMYDEQFRKFLKDNKTAEHEIDYEISYSRVLCGMKLPGADKNEKIDKMINKLDLKPTLAYLCNIEDGFSLGTNIFESKDFICLNNERIITQDYYYNGNWYNIQTGEQVKIEEIPQEQKEKLENYYNYMKRELDISFSININDLLSKRD